jgi:hypothetical protein
MGIRNSSGTRTMTRTRTRTIGAGPAADPVPIWTFRLEPSWKAWKPRKGIAKRDRPIGYNFKYTFPGFPGFPGANLGPELK